MGPTLSLIVISYNTRQLTLEALASFYRSTKRVDYEIIVVDNASEDGSADAIAQAFPQVRLIRSPENLGFARANNIAVKQARGYWILLLNPDTEVFDGAVDRLVAFALAHPENGIYGGRTVFPDGSLNIASCWNRITPWSVFCRAVGLSSLFKNSIIFDPESIGGYKRDFVRRVDIVVGCLFLIRRELWEHLGGFDASYWMYGEEADLCLRARELGYHPIITPEATIMHIMGAASSSSVDKFVGVFKARMTLIRRHWSPLWRWWGISMIWLWGALRFVASSALGVLNPSRFGTKRQHWRNVWKARRDWLAGYPAATISSDVQH